MATLMRREGERGELLQGLVGLGASPGLHCPGQTGRHGRKLQVAMAGLTDSSKKRAIMEPGTRQKPRELS